MKQFTAVLLIVATVAAAAELPRRTVERQVRHELTMLPYYGIFDDLAFRVDGVKVELFGAVIRPTLKDDAERAVRTLERVEIVENHIEVLPLSPDDDRIRFAAYRAIYSHPALSRYALQAVPPIHIIVKNGNVTLRGAAAIAADKAVAAVQANTIPGVHSVTNELAVDAARYREHHDP